MYTSTLWKFSMAIFCFLLSSNLFAQSHSSLYGHDTYNTYQSQCGQASNERTYGIIYSANYKGDYEMIGNTLLRSSNVSDMSNNELGNSRNMVFVDADNLSSTSNSSAASLNLPAGSTIEFARIYWGAMVYCQQWNSSTVQNVKLRKDNGAYTTWKASRVNLHPNDYNRSQIEYLAYVDITDWLQTTQLTNGSANGTYWVADIAATTGNYSQAGAYGGWTMVVAYRNANSPYRSIRLYDGYQNVFDEGHSYINTISLKNLNVPEGTVSARLGVAIWEGDGNISGDYMKFNGSKVSNSASAKDNISNGTISGAKTTSTRTPSYANQLSIDIDQFDVSSSVKSGDKDATVIFATTGDSYYPGVLCFSAKYTTPIATIAQSVKNENGSKFLTSGRLVYTLTAVNNSPNTGYDSYIVDSIPPGLNIPANPVVQISKDNGATWTTSTNFSLNTINGTQILKLNIGAGATALKGGTLAAGETVLVRFYAIVTNAKDPITNLATVYTHSALNDEYLDESTTVINPSVESILPVTFSDFSVSRSGDNAVLQWITLSEVSNKSFDVERSTDAVSFTTLASVAGKGDLEHGDHYEYADPLKAVNSLMVYYRLKLKAVDGSAAYTKVIALKLDQGAVSSFTVFPNPFKSQAKLVIDSDKESVAKIKLSSASGQVIGEYTTPVQKGSNVLLLTQLAEKKAGLYILQVTINGKTSSQQIIKQ